MTEVDISPLAKRLAEENNVDWRALNGSGEEGRIVERDVLDYLAKVMAGDEAADPTPEPLPDGMEQWPDQPPVASDDGWSRSAGDASAGSPGTASDDALLEVETESAVDVSPSSQVAADEWAPGDWGADDWGSAGGSSGSEDSEVDTDGFFGGFGENASSVPAPSAEETVDFGDRSNGEEFDFGSGGEDDSGFAFEAEPFREDNSVFDTSSVEPAIDEGIFLFGDEEQSEEPAASAAPASSDDDNLFDIDEETSAGAVEGIDSQHTSWDGRGASATHAEEEVAASGDGEDAPWEAEESQDSELPGSDAPWSAVDEEGVSEEPVSADLHEAVVANSAVPANGDNGEVAAEAAATDEGYSYLDRVDESLPAGVSIEEQEQRVRSAVEEEPSPVDVPEERVPTPPAAVRGAVSGGMVLRREVDLTALIEARQALSAELGEQASLAAFLLRAAARAGRPWPLQSEGAQVGLASLSDDGVGVSVIPSASDVPFRELIAACAGHGVEGGEAGLVAADVSDMGIDEAVLDLGVPVLTIGRVLEGDGQRYRSTLTLSGISTPDSGSKFLARVVDLLAAPVRLVL